MNQLKQRGLRYIIPASIAAVLIFAAVWTFRQATTNVNASPPDVPAFEGEVGSRYFEFPESENAELITVVENPSNWVTVMEDDFESGVIDGAKWNNYNPNNPGEILWGVRPVNNSQNPASQNSAWGIGGGTVGDGYTPGQDGYPANVDTWLRAGPYNVADAVEGSLIFSYSLDADAGDIFRVAISNDGSNWTTFDSTGTIDWATSSVSLTPYLNGNQLYVAFNFQSDDSGSLTKAGAFIDDVSIELRYPMQTHLPVIAHEPTPTPIATATPVATATPPPSSTYRDNFTDTIVPWNARRWTDGASYDLKHVPTNDCDGGRCGFLQLKVNNKTSYVLVSPMAQSRSIPYNVQTVALFKDAKNGHGYSIIFGGDWNGQSCPNSDFTSCFNHYYEMRAEYNKDDSGPYINMKLKRIDNHDNDNQNQGPDLIPWTKVKTSGWVKWDVTVHEDGKICIAANKAPVADCVYDSTYLGNHYFGLMVRNNNLNSNARVKFDHYQIDWTTRSAELFEGVPAIRYTEETMPPSTTD